MFNCPDQTPTVSQAHVRKRRVSSLTVLNKDSIPVVQLQPRHFRDGVEPVASLTLHLHRLIHSVDILVCSRFSHLHWHASLFLFFWVFFVLQAICSKSRHHKFVASDRFKGPMLCRVHFVFSQQSVSVSDLRANEKKSPSCSSFVCSTSSESECLTAQSPLL